MRLRVLSHSSVKDVFHFALCNLHLYLLDRELQSKSNLQVVFRPSATVSRMESCTCRGCRGGPPPPHHPLPAADPPLAECDEVGRLMESHLCHHGDLPPHHHYHHHPTPWLADPPHHPAPGWLTLPHYHHHPVAGMTT